MSKAISQNSMFNYWIWLFLDIASKRKKLINSHQLIEKIKEHYLYYGGEMGTKPHHDGLWQERKIIELGWAAICSYYGKKNNFFLNVNFTIILCWWASCYLKREMV